MLAVAVMLAVLAVPMAVNDSGSAASQGSQEHTVVYHPYYEGKEPNVQETYNDTATPRDVTITYYGSFVTTEYNPQVWAGSNDALKSNWYQITEGKDRGYSKAGVNNTIVFTGWAYAIYMDGQLTGITAEKYYPGEVMSEQDMANATGSDGYIHVYATWDVMNGFSGTFDDITFTGGNEFTNIVYRDTRGPARLENLESMSVDLTVRGTEGAYLQFPGELRKQGFSLNQNLIIDNIQLYGSYDTKETHGDGLGGFYANGHVLIIGTGVTQKVDDATSLDLEDFTQVSGGSKDGVVTNTVASRDLGEDGNPVKFGSFVIIHSGTYANIVSGSNSRNIGTSTDNLSTYLVVRDVTVLDSLVGGGVKYGTLNGDSYVYAYGLKMYGDNYEEKALGHTAGIPVDVNEGTGYITTIKESSILTGGPNHGTISGDTHVYLGGDTSVWDVQGGGRRGGSEVDTANVEVSGKAVVKHVLCGSITDGLNSTVGKAQKCVKNVNLVVTDEAKVASVFGAGYDTYYQAQFASMYGGGTIDITISGDAMVGYVYGGGYRGTIGSSLDQLNDSEGEPPSSDWIDSITINIEGGTILGDVFGGGRGGVDKIEHNFDGTYPDNTSNMTSTGDATGYSRVYADKITINVTGGTIDGNVYGGGESVPGLGGTLPPGKNEEYKIRDNVAAVKADTITINVGTGEGQENSPVIKGSVFGSGKGIDTNSLSGKPTIIAIDNTKAGLIEIPWFVGENYDSNEFGYITNSKYEEFAKVDANAINIRFDGYKPQGVTEELTDDGSIYGGGEMAKTTVGNIKIDIKDSTLTRCVYGGGKGSTENHSGDERSVMGSVEVEQNLTITVEGDSDIGHDGLYYAMFGGGQKAYLKAGLIIIDLEGTGVRIHGDVHGGGLGEEGHDHSMLDANRGIILNGAEVDGNIYGGSRFGQDGEAPRDDAGAGAEYYTSYIGLVSGTVAQNVYGGGFQSVSWMDSEIYIGSDAIEFSDSHYGIDPVNAPLNIRSVYGGGNLNGIGTDGTEQGKPFEESLLKGDTLISIGFEEVELSDGVVYAGDSRYLRITGDLFGEGNYSTIEGTSNISIHDYRMPDDYWMGSIQRCDDLSIEDSTLNLSGSADGGEVALTSMFSIVHIGTMSLDAVTLDLNAATAEIQDYYSYRDGALATAEDCVRDGGNEPVNEIILHGGRVLSLLDIHNIDDNQDGQPHHGTVHGYTLLTRAESDNYYGAFAMANAEVADNSGFMVNDGADEANSTVSGEVRTWYLAGHMNTEYRVPFKIGSEDYSDNLTAEIPKLSGDSVYTYIGAYVDPTVRDGLHVVEGSSYTGNTELQAVKDSTVLSMSIGDQAVYTHTYNSGTWDRAEISQTELGKEIGGITTSLLNHDGYKGPVGIAGKVTIHLTESMKTTVDGNETYIPVNFIDISLEIVITAPDGNELTFDITLIAKKEGDNMSGTGYLNLPAMTDNTTYVLDRVSGFTGSELKLWCDDRHLGLSGWTDMAYPQDRPYTVNNDGSDMGVNLGMGGVKDTTVALQYTGAYNGEGSKFTLEINGSNDNNETITYTVNVTVVVPDDIDLVLSYTDLENNQYYLSKTGDSLVWVNTESILNVPYGTVLSTDAMSEGSDTTWQEAIEQKFAETDVYIRYDGEKLLVSPTEQDGYTLFNYKENLSGWYLDDEHLSRFAMDTELKEDTDLYAGFGVRVTFHGMGANLNVPQVLLEPGQSLSMLYDPFVTANSDKKGIYDTSNDLPGYKLEEEDRNWKFYGEGGVLTTWYFDSPVYTNLDLYLDWTPEQYLITIEVTGMESGYDLSVADKTLNGNTFTASYGESVTIGAGSGVVIINAFIDGKNTIFTGTNTSQVTFTVPVGNPTQEVGYDGVLTVHLTLTEGRTLTVELIEDGYSLNSSETLEVSMKNDSVESEITFRGNGEKYTLPLVAGNVGIVFNPSKSGYATEDSMHWAIWYSTDGENYTLVDDRNGVRSYIGKSGYVIDDVTTDLFLRIGLYNEVKLNSLGVGIGSVTVTDSISTGGSWTVEEGDSLYSGDMITITPSEGYMLPPNSSYGVDPRPVSSTDDSETYRVLGNTYVAIGDLPSRPDKVTVTVTLEDGNGTLSGFTGNITTTMTLTGADGRQFSSSVSISYTNGVGTYIFKDISRNSPYTVSASIAGFVTGTVTEVGGTGDGEYHASVDLVIIEYTITFIGEDSSEEGTWNVLSGTGIPKTDVATATLDGVPIWTLKDGAIVYDLSPEMFDEQDSLELHAIPVPEGSLPEASDTVYVTESMFDGEAFSCTLDFNSDVSFAYGNLSINYNHNDQTLTLPTDMKGTGKITLHAISDDGTLCSLTIVSYADGHGMVI